MSASKALRSLCLAATMALLLLAVLASAALAASPVYECIPNKAGAVVVAGSESGECKSSSVTTYTPVALPASAEEQHQLLAILPYLKYVASGVGGKPTIQVSGANLQILNGEGKTNTNNGAGNVVIGYDEAPGRQEGSHNLMLGGAQSFRSYGTLIGGYHNTTSAPFSAALGGQFNEASAEFAVALGGEQNMASGTASTVSGGQVNASPGELSSVSGGEQNASSSLGSSVSGGKGNAASGEDASISGGRFNKTDGPYASVSGGREAKAEGTASTVTGGYKNRAEGGYSSVLGGKELTATLEYEAVL